MQHDTLHGETPRTHSPPSIWARCAKGIQVGEQVDDTSPARLVISLRPGPQERAAGWRRFALAVASVRSLVSGHPLPARNAPTSVHIDDLQGHNFLHIDSCPPVIDFRLPPGTYHVTACRQSALRRYTVTLMQGFTARLPLRMPGREGSEPRQGEATRPSNPDPA